VVKMTVVVVVEVVMMVVTGCGGCRGKEVCARAGLDDDAHFWSVVENPVRVGVLYELELTQSRVHVLLLLVPAQQHAVVAGGEPAGVVMVRQRQRQRLSLEHRASVCDASIQQLSHSHHQCTHHRTATTNAHTTTEFDMVKSHGDKREKRHAGLAFATSCDVVKQGHVAGLPMGLELVCLDLSPTTHLCVSKRFRGGASWW
jgi:hypothetical protein